MVAKNLSAVDEVYSTYPEFEYEYANVKEPETLQPIDQRLVISLNHRKVDGAPITVITGFVGRRIDLLNIERELVEVCRTCGSSLMYEIILVRDVRKRAYVYLRNQGYGVQFAMEKH
jgi:translation initiation factor 1 (eIF-1/SUI1)